MLANREWEQYSIKRASLRVTIKKPGQRSTYFLQLPYIFSVPLMAVSVLLHWFISQSIFVQRVTTYSPNDPDHVIRAENDLGYSQNALLGTIVCSSVMIGVCLLVSILFTYPTKGMPIGGTNSAIISAACHVRSTSNEQDKSTAEDDIVCRPLKWGVTKEGSPDTAGHCSFSDREVTEPTVGFLYASLK